MDIDVLKGKTLRSIITNADYDYAEDEEIASLLFSCDDGTHYLIYHQQDCCEKVALNETIGYFADLLDTPILEASKRSNSYDGGTWTFYELRTIKGSVTLRWLGESNGYYSEEVTFAEAEQIPGTSKWKPK